MPFDNSTRNRLAGFVKKARDLITAEFTQQFQELYGIGADGNVSPIDALTHLDENGRDTAALLRERIRYLVRTHPEERGGPAAAVTRLAREQAFTVLNRLAAIRMAEKRDLILESVGKGYQSTGFRLFKTVAGVGLGDAYQSYRRYLFCLFDELAVDLGALFNRHSPQGLLFPRETALLALLDLLNASDLDVLWAEDETIGWIYQYYNDPLERKKMREASAAPRNSRELAVRNQFFTPRYVVEFLTDNTLGRIWYEMRQGNTRLKEQCRYLVRRPSEIFLKPGESAPEQPKQDNLSQEELLKQPVFIPHRPLKDPRTILMLDPACGSMHFGLYAFDLFQVIYEEAWEWVRENLDENGRIKKEALNAAPAMLDFLEHCYCDDKAAFLKNVPQLIVERNIHGIDIDPRAAQIAGLSLWLRAQRAWKDLGLKPAVRPEIRRSNIVCAEPMPGDKELLRQFVENEFPPVERSVYLRLLETVFDKMQLAGEAGSLLKIEEEIRTAIAEAKQLWKAGPKLEQTKLFGELELAKQKELTIDLSGITDEQFWSRVEEEIYQALAKYAAQSESAGGFQRRLFAEDAARGFAFIDVCRKRYDVALMNPPFGEPTESIEHYLGKQYPRTKNNLYCAFVERQFDLCPGGFVGLISARTFIMYRDFEKFRRELLLGSASVVSFADLGWEVLDGAQVETAAFVLARNSKDASAGRKLLGPFIKLLNVPVAEKGDCLLRVCNESHHDDVYFVDREQFFALPGAPLAYWASPRLVELFSKSLTFEPALAYCGRGAAAHVFFFRLAWEIPSVSSTADNWRRLAHGGEYSPFFRENSVFIDWENNGRRVKEYILKQYPYLDGNFGWAIQDEDKYGRVGLTSGKRNERFNVQLMPAGHIFTNEGQGFIPHETKDVWFALGYLNSSLVSYFLALTSGLQKTWVYIRPVPVVELDAGSHRFVEVAAEESFRIKHQWSAGAEEAALFVAPWIFSLAASDSLRRSIERLFETHKLDSSALDKKRSELSDAILFAIKLDAEDQAEIAEDFKRHPKDFAFPLWRDATGAEVEQEVVLRLASYLVGISFGRWDIRYATNAKSAPELPDPFAPLPVCPPGQLQNAQGLPARPEDMPDAYPLKNLPWDGILVDDPGHKRDIESRVQEILEIIWKDRWESIEQEACEILGVKSLRDYFRRTSKSKVKGVEVKGFFEDHLARYSKSRRQAPNFWPLSTRSGSYTLWIYYHRLTDQTLHTTLADFVDPKIRDTTKALDAARAANRGAEAGELADLLDELKDFRAELERIIKLPWKPNLNDGVLITASPLWKLFRLGKWQQALKSCWEELEAGNYDWAHLAYTIWPDRVRGKCKADRSIAIAHGLEELCEVKAPEKKAKKGKKRNEQIDLEVEG